MKNFSIILKKELVRVFTDKKLVFNTFILSPLILVIIYTIMGSQIDKLEKDIDTHISDVYIQQAPEEFLNLIDNADNVNTITQVKNSEIQSIKDDIYSGEADLLIIFDENLTDKISNYKTDEYIPEVKTYYNPSEEYSQKAYNQFISYLDKYEDTIIAQRVEKPEYLNAFDIDRTNKDKYIINEKKAVGKGLGRLLPMLLMIFLFAAAMGVGIDMIAGEKERGTMATLLITPVKRYHIALGKTVSLGIISIVASVCSFAGLLITLKTAPQVLTGSSSITVGVMQYGFTELFMLLTVMISVVCIFVGLICLLSMSAKNIKEASTLISPVYIIVMIASFLNIFSNQTPEMWQFAVPVYGTTIAIKSILAFEMTWMRWIVTCGSSLIIAGVLILIIAKMFNSEKIMYSK